MPANADIVFEPFQQLCHQQMHGAALFRCPGIFRIPAGIQTTFIADAYTMSVVSLTMRTDNFQRTRIHHRTVTADVIVIADTTEAATTVRFFQLFHRKAATLASGGTVDNDVIDCSHTMIY